MDPNYIGIRRVYTREQGQLVADQTIEVGAPPGNEIVVEWEAGATANAGGPFTLEILTYNVTVWGLEPALTVAPVAVATDGENRNGTYEYTTPFGAGVPINTTFEITASLLRPNNTVSFAKWMFCTF